MDFFFVGFFLRPEILKKGLSSFHFSKRSRVIEKTEIFRIFNHKRPKGLLRWSLIASQTLVERRQNMIHVFQNALKTICFICNRCKLGERILGIWHICSEWAIFKIGCFELEKDSVRKRALTWKNYDLMILFKDLLTNETKFYWRHVIFASLRFQIESVRLQFSRVFHKWIYEALFSLSYGTDTSIIVNKFIYQTAVICRFKIIEYFLVINQYER